MKKIFLLVFFFFLTGCATRNPLSDFRFQTVTAPPYVLASWHRIAAPEEPIRIYIEGDGNSFDAFNHPTDNPTPTTPFLREIAAADPNPNVAYLARPCQYMKTSTCTVEDWTNGRFSPQIVNSMEQSVYTLMKKAKTKEVILIGYSGGAQIAGLVAVKNPTHVKKIITIAGVLDQKAWTAYHNDTPLNKSLNLKDYQDVFNKIPQIHYIGSKDSVVPNSLTYEFVANPTTIVTVSGADHQNGFKNIYKEIYQQQ